MKKFLALILAIMLICSSLLLASCEKTCKYEDCDNEPADNCDGYCKIHYAIVKGSEFVGDLFS